MQINADLTLPAIVDSARLAWVVSPIAGVERRMLERDGGEVARATSLVRYAPGSAFSPHRHDAGEEFLVLDGVFSDETGDFPAGFYVRNPPGSRHTPASAPGAVILVKLRQMPESETQSVRIDTTDPASWRRNSDTLEQAPLFEAAWERVDLIRLAAGHAGAAETFPGGIELFVVSGDIMVDDHVQPPGTHRSDTWLRFPADTTIALASRSGATLYRKTGHLLQH